MKEKLSGKKQRNREGLVMGSPSHKKLTKIVTEKQLLNDSSQISKQTHTALVKVFHFQKYNNHLEASSMKWRKS